jgi:hypothetical protein
MRIGINLMLFGATPTSWPRDLIPRLHQAGAEWISAARSTPAQAAAAECFASGLAELSAATRIWRDVTGEPSHCATRSLRFLRELLSHPYFTTKPQYVERMLDFVDSPLLGLNMDIPTDQRRGSG